MSENKIEELLTRRMDKIESKQDNQQKEIQQLRIDVTEIKSDNKTQMLLLNQINDNFEDYKKKQEEKEQKQEEENIDTKRTIKHKILDALVGGGITAILGYIAYLINK